MAGENTRGYGPRCRLLFDGDESKYELWEVKFLGYLRTIKLHGVVDAEVPDAEKKAIAHYGHTSLRPRIIYMSLET